MIKGKGRKVSKLIKGSKELSQGRHEGIFLYQNENVLVCRVREPSKGRRPSIQAREVRQASQGRHDGLLLYLNENVLVCKIGEPRSFL